VFNVPALYLRKKRDGTQNTGGWLGPKVVWKGVENLAFPTERYIQKI
jgi:hypothetical protein